MTVSKKGNAYVLPNEKESSEGRVSRLKKIYNRSRIKSLVQAKRYRKGKPTKREVRAAAIMREKYRAEKEKKRFYS